MITDTIPKASEIAVAARVAAQEEYAGMKHSSRLTVHGAAEKLKKLVRAEAEKLTQEIVGQVLHDHRWTYEEMAEQSSIDFQTEGMRHHPKHLLSLFEPHDVIWCGEVYEATERNFRTRDEWLTYQGAFPPLTCPSTFQPGVYSLAQVNSICQRYLVVESETLDRDTVGGVFRWLRQENGLTLRAVINTGGKSLHAWFVHPGEAVAADLKLVLPTLGCDRRMFVPTQPCRMPGVGRNGGFQKLVCFN